MIKLTEQSTIDELMDGWLEMKEALVFVKAEELRLRNLIGAKRKAEVVKSTGNPNTKIKSTTIKHQDTKVSIRYQTSYTITSVNATKLLGMWNDLSYIEQQNLTPTLKISAKQYKAIIKDNPNTIVKDFIDVYEPPPKFVLT